MTVLAEFYESGNAPHEALGRAARRLSNGGALYLGGGVGIEKLKKGDAETFSITKGDGKKGESFSGPLSAVIRGMTLAGGSTAADSPGGAQAVPDPAAAARLRELSDREREIQQDIDRYTRRLASRPKTGMFPTAPGIDVADDRWEARRVSELNVELAQVRAERQRLVATGKIEEAAEAGKPGTNWKQVTPANRKKVDPLVKHWMKEPHPFTACYRELAPEKGAEAAKRICAVVKDMGMRTTRWRKGGKGKVSEEANAILEAAMGRLAVVEEEFGLAALVQLAEGVESPLPQVAQLAEAVTADLALLALAGHPLAEAVFGVEHVEERQFGEQKRKRLAAKGHAMSDGSFPIETVGDLANAKRALGRAPEGKRDAVKAHIRKRAKALGVKVSEAELEESFASSTSPGMSSPNAARSAQRGLSPAQRSTYASSSRSSGSSGGKFDPAKHKRGAKGTSQGGKFVAQGASGEQVRAVQARVGVKQDGQFGNLTHNAVRDFQKRHGLKVDGVVGHQTALALSGKYTSARRATPGAMKQADRSALGRIRQQARAGRKASAPTRARGGVVV